MPVRMGAPMGDLSGGLFASQGILAALYQREKTGRGQRIDISLVDCQTSLLTYRAQFYLVGKEIARPVGSGHVSAHPIRAFRTKTFDVVIDANTESIFAELCDAIGKPEMAQDEKFNSRENRLKNKEELYAILEKAFLAKTGEEWLELLEKRIPIAPINTIDKALADPQTLSRNMVVEVEYAERQKTEHRGKSHQDVRGRAGGVQAPPLPGRAYRGDPPRSPRLLAGTDQGHQKRKGCLASALDSC